MPFYTGFIQCRRYETENTYYAIAEQPLDNYSVGIIKTTSGTYDISTNLAYVNYLGEAYRFDLKGYSNETLDDISFYGSYAETYPKIADTFSTTPLFEKDNIVVKKDRYEKNNICIFQKKVVILN